MFGPLGHLSRAIKLFILVTVLVLGPTLYFLYPTPERLPGLGEWQSGGIDSDHWRAPIKPDFSKGEGWEMEQGRGWGDELAIGSNGVGDVTKGGVIMPKLGNETAKAELGRAAWRVLHLMTLRFPDKPTEDDRLALKSYFHLFSRLYPCGECAAEFQKLLKDYPPQTSSRKSASLWLCHVHNLVNERLGKEEFDCLTLDEAYDCGCGDDATASDTTLDTNNDENERDVAKALKEGIPSAILSEAGGALLGEFEVAAEAEGAGLSAQDVEEERILEAAGEELQGQEEVGEHEWKKSQVVKADEWENEKAEHGVD